MLMKKRSLKFTLILALAAATGPLHAEGFHDGVSAYEKGDLQAALRAWRPAAEQGDALAQYNLGALYAKGRGVNKDVNEAAKWFRRAAEQGNALAEYYLGGLYARGEGVAHDTTQAAHWYHLAAAHGIAQAQVALSKLPSP